MGRAARALASPQGLRFAAVGVVNTVLDVVLFLLLDDLWGVVLANLVSTSAGMTFSFVVNGLVTFEAGRLTLGHAVRFLATTGATMWVLSPLVIHAGLALGATALVAKLAAVGLSFVVNFLAYRYLVWPAEQRRAREQTVSPAPARP